jgi:hypothetical protein
MTAPAGPTPDSTAPAPQSAPAAPQQETFPLSYVQELREEAASHRTKAKTAAEEARNATIQEYEGKFAEKDAAFTELQGKFYEASTDLLKLNAVLAAEIPVSDVLEVVALVQGNDAKSISESVQRVKALLGKAPASVSAVDRTQGTGGGTIPLNGNPVLDMLKNAVGAR